MLIGKINYKKTNLDKNNKYLKDFLNIYDLRPIKNNIGGMNIIHLYNLYCVIRKIKPTMVVESGAYKGLSSWFILKASPKAKVYCFDTNLNQLEFKSKRIKYFERDIKNFNFYNLPKKSLLVLDDHQNQIERLKQSILFGFNYIFFDDDSDDENHDFYTIKHQMKKKKFNHVLSISAIIKNFIIFFKLMLKKVFNQFISYTNLEYRLRDYNYFPSNILLINKYVKKIYSLKINNKFFKKNYPNIYFNKKRNGTNQTLIVLK